MSAFKYFDSQGWIKGQLQSLAEKWFDSPFKRIQSQRLMKKYNCVVFPERGRTFRYGVELSCFKCCNTHSHNGPAHTHMNRYSHKITLAPQSLSAVMPALYSLSINKISPCAFRGPAGNTKTVCNSQENLVQNSENLHTSLKTRTSSEKKKKDLLENQWSCLGSSYKKDKNQTMIGDRSLKQWGDTIRYAATMDWNQVCVTGKGRLAVIFSCLTSRVIVLVLKGCHYHKLSFVCLKDLVSIELQRR